MSKELASLGAAAPSPAPTWGKVLGSLKLWGIAPASQSAAATPVPPHRDQGVMGGVPGPGSSSQSRRQLNLSNSETDLVEAQSRALSESDALRAPGGSGRGRARPFGTASAQQQDRLFSSLDSSQVNCCCTTNAFNTPPPTSPQNISPTCLACTSPQFLLEHTKDGLVAWQEFIQMHALRCAVLKLTPSLLPLLDPLWSIMFTYLCCNVQVSSSESRQGWDLGRRWGWGQSKSVGARVGQSGKTAYR